METWLIVVIVASAVAGSIIGMLMAKAVIMGIAHAAKRRRYKKNPILAEYKEVELKKKKLLDEIMFSQYEIMDLKTQVDFVNGREAEELDRKIKKAVDVRTEKIRECNKLQEKVNELREQLNKQTA